MRGLWVRLRRISEESEWIRWSGDRSVWDCWGIRIRGGLFGILCKVVFGLEISDEVIARSGVRWNV